MDAREFKFDDPLPRTCKHCKWGAANPDPEGMPIHCQNESHKAALAAKRGVKSIRKLSCWVDSTCDQWEEKA